MSKGPNYNWNESKIIDDLEYQVEDAKLFQTLLNHEEKAIEKGDKQCTRVGEILSGTIIEMTSDFMVVDVGLKSEGLIPINELKSDEKASLKAGENIEVLLERAEGEDGQIVLSREKARRQRKWEYILNHSEEGSIVHGKILRKVKGGLIVDIGMEAFLPASQIDNKKIKNLDPYIGEEYEFKILKINPERKNIVISRREILEAERNSKKAEILDTIEEGQLHRGTVKNITDFGVFLDLSGIDGLLHITDMTWKRIKHPSEVVQIGDELEVLVLHIDKEKGRIALGLKQKEQNPWEEIEQRYPPGTRVTGKIVNLVPYGAFIEIEPGIEGLIHLSEMSWVKNVSDPNEVVKQGDVVDAIVLSIQKEDGKISLGIKQTGQNPWETVKEHYPIGKVVSTKVRHLANYGAFVEIAPGIDGLIHISDMSWGRKISHPSDLLEKGDSVDALVLSVDQESKKITLGLKQLEDNPWETIYETCPVGSSVHGKVDKISTNGIVITLENGIDAFVHTSEISDQNMQNIEDSIKIGDTITGKITKIDIANQKVLVSIRDHLIEKKAN